MAGEPPVWLNSLIAEVCEAEGVPLPLRVTAWLSKPVQKHTTGCYTPARSYLSLVLGTDQEQARLVATHELAHHVTASQIGVHENHGARFWQIAWRLYRLTGQVEIALRMEPEYKVAAGQVAVALGIPGARAAVAAVRARRPAAQTQLTIRPGTRVSLTDGKTGTIVRPLETRYAVKIDGDWREWRYPARMVKEL